MSAVAQTKLVPARAAKTPADLATTLAAIGRYELVCRLGHGGMASVYLARVRGSAGFERVVAIKVIHPHLASEPEFVEMFLDEAKIAAKIHHPHVVEIIDLGAADGLFYMAMEYVEGDTLAVLLRRLRQAQQRLPVAAISRIAIDAASGLAAAHRLTNDDGQPLHLVHRDVSPHNLLVDIHGGTKVVDFGIMKAAGKPSTTLTGQLRGKLAYMSPEQARGETVDRRTDIFALGVVLWEMCANERLFGESTEAAVLTRVSACDVPPLAERAPDIPEELRRVVHRCLQPQRDDRYSDADALADDLKAIARSFGEDEPRALLASVMETELGARIAYRRQLARKSGDVRDLEDEPDPTLAVSNVARTPSRSSFSRTSLSRSNLSGASVSGATSAARRWPMWLALPLLGAGAAVFFTRSGLPGGAGSTPTPVEAPTVAAPAVALQASQAASPEKDEPTVQWWINTIPQGAAVSIDGTTLDQVTPTTVEVPRGRQPLTVVLHKEGFETREFRLAPVTSENHTLALEPLAAPPQAKVEFRAPMSAKAPRKTADPDTTEASRSSTASADGRTLEDIPDFRGGKER